MKRLLIFVLFLAIPCSVHAFEKVYTPSELINSITLDNKLNGQKIVLEGEAISEPLERKDGCWINVTDGSIAIGVFFKDKTQANKINIWGQHHFKGDTVRIEGKVFLADKETGGELDVQGENLTIITAGYRIEETIPLWKIIAGLILGVITLALMLERFFSFLRTKKAKMTNVIEGLFDPNKID
jgi:aspartyl/asparaginyl-tRNA synthetase